MTQPLAFCNYLRGVIDSNKAQDENPLTGTGLNPAQTQLVKDKLNSVFKHVIDPSYPPHLQATLQQAHSGKNTPNDNGGFYTSQTHPEQNKPRSTGGLEILC